MHVTIFFYALNELNIIYFTNNHGTFYSFIHSFIFSLHAELLNCFQYLLFLYSWYFTLYFTYFCTELLQYSRVAWWTRPMNSVCIWVRAWSHSWCHPTSCEVILANCSLVSWLERALGDDSLRSAFTPLIVFFFPIHLLAVVVLPTAVATAPVKWNA